MKLFFTIVSLLAGSLSLSAQQGYTYEVDEDFEHYEFIYREVEGLFYTENNQIIISARFHSSSGHFSLIRLFSDGTYDDSFGYTNSNGGGGGKYIAYQMAICVFTGHP